MKTLNELVAELQDLQSEIRDHKDGFIYRLKIRSYGNNWEVSYPNSYLALQGANEYNQDNGYCDLYTDNPELSDSYITGGEIYDLNGNMINSCNSYDYAEAECEDQDPYYHMSCDEREYYELRDLIEEEIRIAYANQHFTHGLGMNIIEKDIWFTSDELEAFNIIWLRRLQSA